MKKSEEGRVEELSKLVGGRFRLTVLIQKQAEEYYAAGRTFMPSVRNFDELFNYILDEIEDGKIELQLREPGEEPEPKLEPADILGADEQI
jgi:DNA-directed RNA polymerase subunit K/omega